MWKSIELIGSYLGCASARWKGVRWIPTPAGQIEHPLQKAGIEGRERIDREVRLRELARRRVGEGDEAAVVPARQQKADQRNRADESFERAYGYDSTPHVDPVS